jgi:hypothetical protein
MVGRLGLAKLVLLPLRKEKSGGHTHELFITQPNKRPSIDCETPPG